MAPRECGTSLTNDALRPTGTDAAMSGVDDDDDVVRRCDPTGVECVRSPRGRDERLRRINGGRSTAVNGVTSTATCNVFH